MTVYERIRELRKNLNFTQEEFAKKINLSRSNFAHIEVGTINLTQRVIADIVREFKINREWLVDGTGPMIDESNAIDDIARQYNLSDSDRRTIEAYTELTPEQKTFIQRQMERLLTQEAAAKAKEAAELAKEAF
jgi:transcriptional regulator with XRE-family HTH domain